MVSLPTSRDDYSSSIGKIIHPTSTAADNGVIMKRWTLLDHKRAINLNLVSIKQQILVDLVHLANFLCLSIDILHECNQKLMV